MDDTALSQEVLEIIGHHAITHVENVTLDVLRVCMSYTDMIFFFNMNSYLAV